MYSKAWHVLKFENENAAARSILEYKPNLEALSNWSELPVMEADEIIGLKADIKLFTCSICRRKPDTFRWTGTNRLWLVKRFL